MKPGRILLYSFLLTVPVWLLFSWPLVRHVATGIPSSARNTEKNGVRYMIQGDHLQLLYHFWLAQDMIAGKTHLFHNPYEFNRGDDSARYAPGTYYAPFSLVFAAISIPFGRAVAWNAVGFLSLWLTLFFAWLLARRYTERPEVAAVVALVSVLLPYRWINLLGGSPAGFAMLWPPLLILGLDLAVRADSVKGGVLAGIALLFACFSDSHVFYFSMLMVPAWCVVAFIRREVFEWRSRRHYTSIALALAPAAVLGFAGLVYRARRARRLADTAGMAGGRSWDEVGINSPAWQGLFSFRDLGQSNQIFVGCVIAVLLAIGFFLAFTALFDKRRKTGWRQCLVLMCVCIGILGIVCLALGTRGPLEGKALLFCRKFLPKYKMIRQPAKIFTVLPPLLTIGLAIALTALRNAGGHKNRGPVSALSLVFCLCTVIECKLHVNATVSLLATGQPAYAAVTDDAGAEAEPHALVIPLWPGDSAWTSLYQHYVSLYRIRMVNGYSPVVKRNYKPEVFDRLGSCNKGVLTTNQLDMLRSMKIGYVILHEDAFPEKVSPLPVAFTLRNLLDHPHLELLKQSGPIWAFRVLEEPHEREPRAPDWKVFFPARRHEFERGCDKSMVTEAEDVSSSAFVSLSDPGQVLATKGTHMVETPDLKWLVRMAGEGVLTVKHLFNGEDGHETTMALNEDGWIWREIPVVSHPGHAKTALSLSFAKGGGVDLDAAILMAGEWTPPPPGESLSLPAALFFHAGATDLDSGGVTFRKLRDHAAFDNHDKEAVGKIRRNKGVVLYGPRLPLPPGPYTVELHSGSSAPDRTTLGAFYVKQGREILGFEYVHAGSVTWAAIEVPYDLPVSVNFLYSGAADMIVEKIVFTREMDE